MKRNSKLTWRLLVGLMAAAILAFGLAACGGSDDDEPAGDTAASTPAETTTEETTETTEEIEDLRAVVFPTTDQAAFFVALDDGIFEKHGLNVDAQIVTDATALTASVTSGKADVMHHALPAMAAARVGGLDVKLISGVAVVPREGYVEVLVKKDSDIQGFADLEGKTGGAAALRGILDLGLYKAIEVEGGDPSNFESVAIPPTDQVAALKANRVDAVSLNDPFLIQGKADPAVRSLGNPFADLDFEALSASAYSTESIIAEKASALRKYKEALAEASQIVTDNPERARQAIADHTELPPEVIEQIGLPGYSVEASPEDVSQILQAMEELGWLEKPLTAEDILWDGN